MESVFDIFSSVSKVKILRTLFLQDKPIPLRHIAYMSELPVFSVQTGIQSLLSDDMVNKTVEDKYVLFELNKTSPFYDVLKQIFIIEIQSRISRESENYNDRARQVLEFVNDANDVFGLARKKRSAA